MYVRRPRPTRTYRLLRRCGACLPPVARCACPLAVPAEPPPGPGSLRRRGAAPWGGPQPLPHRHCGRSARHGRACRSGTTGPPLYARTLPQRRHAPNTSVSATVDALRRRAEHGKRRRRTCQEASVGLAARDLDHLAVHWDVHRPQLVLVKSLLVNFAALHLAPQERPPVVCGVDTYPHTPPGAREWDVVRPDSSGVSMRESARSTCTRPAPVTTTPWLNPAPMHVIFSWRSSSFRPARGTAALYQYVSPSPTWPRSPLPHVNARPSAVVHTRMSHNTRPHAHTRLVCAHEAVRAASNAPAERPRLPRTC